MTFWDWLTVSKSELFERNKQQRWLIESLQAEVDELRKPRDEQGRFKPEEKVEHKPLLRPRTSWQKARAALENLANTDEQRTDRALKPFFEDQHGTEN